MAARMKRCCLGVAWVSAAAPASCRPLAPVAGAPGLWLWGICSGRGVSPGQVCWKPSHPPLNAWNWGRPAAAPAAGNSGHGRRARRHSHGDCRGGAATMAADVSTMLLGELRAQCPVPGLQGGPATGTSCADSLRARVRLLVAARAVPALGGGVPGTQVPGAEAAPGLCYGQGGAGTAEEGGAPGSGTAPGPAALLCGGSARPARRQPGQAVPRRGQAVPQR